MLLKTVQQSSLTYHTLLSLYHKIATAECVLHPQPSSTLVLQRLCSRIHSPTPTHTAQPQRHGVLCSSRMWAAVVSAVLSALLLYSHVAHVRLSFPRRLQRHSLWARAVGPLLPLGSR